jgi:hypothetical protein
MQVVAKVPQGLYGRRREYIDRGRRWLVDVRVRPDDIPSVYMNREHCCMMTRMRNDNALMKRPCSTLDCIARLNPTTTPISKPHFTTLNFCSCRAVPPQPGYFPAQAYSESGLI